MQRQRRFLLVSGLAALVGLIVSGCGPAPVRPPAVAAGAGSRAVAKYDANHDGVLDYSELAKAPGLRAAIGTIKKLAKPRQQQPPESQLRSAKISADESDARIKEWKARGTGRIAVRCLRRRSSNKSAAPSESRCFQVEICVACTPN